MMGSADSAASGRPASAAVATKPPEARKKFRRERVGAIVMAGWLFQRLASRPSRHNRKVGLRLVHPEARDGARTLVRRSVGRRRGFGTSGSANGPAHAPPGWNPRP